jgi:uncharacterized protein
LTSLILLAVAAFLAGLLNSIAGGGSFLSFPALVYTGVPPVPANASNTVALAPGALASVVAYRREFKELGGVNLKLWYAVSLAGGLAGALLLLVTPDSVFRHIAPWLLLFATFLFTFGRQISELLRGRLHANDGLLILMLFPIAVYGGYFGGGIGIMLLAAFRLYGLSNIHLMNAMKTLISGSLNTVAALVFVFAHEVYWRQTAVMIVSGILGGYFGAHYSRKLPQTVIRGVVIVTGVVMTVYFFVRVR